MANRGRQTNKLKTSKNTTETEPKRTESRKNLERMVNCFEYTSSEKEAPFMGD